MKIGQNWRDCWESPRQRKRLKGMSRPSLNAKREQQIEEAIEEPPIDPPVRQEIQHQRRLPLESNTDALPPKTDRDMGAIVE